MPELPEVEALRRGLVKRIVGSKILKVQVLQEKLIAGKGTTRTANSKKTSEFVSKLKGKKIVGIERRAKNLIFKLEAGEIILVHLKMTGQLVFVENLSNNFQNINLTNNERNSLEKFSQRRRARVFSRKVLLRIPGMNETISGGHPIQESENKLPHKHTYIIFTLDNGTLFYNDVRQFGYVLYYPNISCLDEEKHFENIGIEPFDKKFTLKYFQNELDKIKNKKSNIAIKKLLLDQTVVVGCGNIYCDEICWSSSVLPMRAVKSLNKKEIEKIYKNIKKILDRAINSGGSSVANYLLADGKRGNYADYHNVYQKDATVCKFTTPSDSPLKRGRKLRCSGIIEKISFAGRGTHFCPIHQK